MGEFIEFHPGDRPEMFVKGTAADIMVDSHLPFPPLLLAAARVAARVLLSVLPAEPRLTEGYDTVGPEDRSPLEG